MPANASLTIDSRVSLTWQFNYSIRPGNASFWTESFRMSTISILNHFTRQMETMIDETFHFTDNWLSHSDSELRKVETDKLSGFKIIQIIQTI